LADVTGLVVFVRSPGSGACTITLKVHDPLGDRVAPDKLTLLDPEAAVMLPPPHDPVRPLGVATTSPPGRLSVNPTPVSPTLFTWETVKLRLVVAFTGIRLAPNDLLIEGGDSTVTLAVAAPPVPPSTDVTAPVRLFCVPAAVPLTFTLNVHDALMSSVAPVRLTLLPPAVAAIVPPPHDPVRPFGAATVRPAGSVSVKPTPVSASAFAAGFAIVKLRLVVPFRGTVGAPNVLVIAGGTATVTTAVLLTAPAPASVAEIGPVVLA
jgi:hypothetical protein